MAGRKPASKPARRRKKSAPKGFTKEIIAVIAIAVSLLIGVFCYMPSTGYLGDRVFRPFLLGVFGAGAYLVPPVMLALAICSLAIRDHRGNYPKYVLAALLPIIVGVFFNFAAFGNAAGMNLLDVYFAGVEGQGGGLLAALITLPLIAVIGEVASIIVVCTALLIALMYIFRFSIADGLRRIADSARAGRKDEPRKARREERPVSPSQHAPKTKQERQAAFDHIIQTFSDDEEALSEEAVAPEAEPTIKIYGMDESLGASGGDAAQKGETDKPESARKSNTKQAASEKDEKGVAALDIDVDTEPVDYQYPVIDLLSKNPSAGSKGSADDLKKNAKILVDTLKSFGVEVTVLNIERGPTVTRYEVAPSTGVKVSKITNLADDIALNLAARGVRIEAPIPGKAAVGIEVPNKEVTTVYLRDVLDTDVFWSCPSKVAFALGKDISGNTVLADIAKMPHLLIAGATGSGKSVCINTLITSILFKANPNEVKLLMIDPKMVELGVYNGIPHLLIPVVTDPKKAAGALNWAVSEMLGRYKLFADNGVRDLRGYNQMQLEKDEPGQPLPQVLIIIDELADLMMASPHEVEDSICRLAQLARAAGMHLIIATQRPSVDVITGVIKANIPSRISFSVSSQVDSRTILDMAGAEKLLGRGDMLYFPIGEIKPIRLQGAFVTDKEVEKVVHFIRSNGEASYDEDIIEKIENGAEPPGAKETGSDCDALLEDAIEMVVNNGEASVSLIQRKFKVGYARAARIVDQMEERGIVSSPDGSKPRKVLITKLEYQEMLMNTPGSTQD